MGNFRPARTPDPQLFHDVFNASPVGIVVETLEGQPLFVNPAFCAFLGFSHEELRNKHCVDFSPPEDAEKDWNLFQQLRAGSIDHYEMEKRYLRRDGSLVWGQLSLSLLNSRPSPLAIAIVADITQKKVAEESRLRHAAVIESSDDAIATGNLDGTIVSWNAGAQKMYGYSEAEAVGKSITMLLPSELLDEEEKIVKTLRMGGHNEHFETVRVTKAGKKINVSLTISPIKDPNGKIVGCSGVGRDITERKRAEEVRFRHAAIVESSEDAIISEDRDALIASWNAGAERIFGYTEAEAVGQPIGIIIPQELQNEENEIFDRLRAGKRIERYETVRITKTGKRVDVSLNIGPVKDSGGNVVGFFKIAHDISKRKIAEQALRESEQRLRLAQWAARIGTFDVNLQTGGDIWTPETEALYGLPPGAFGGTLTAFEDLIHPDDRQKIIELNDEMMKTGQPAEAEWRVVWPDGSIHWIAGRGQVFMDESGGPSRLLGVNIDITERKQAEEALAGMTRKLIEAQEQDRARIGRDLHDDINQKLALLAIDIERLRDHTSDSAAETRTGLAKIRDRVTALGADVQSLSHQLHSPQLQILGIVAAMRGFCREFAAHQKVAVDFIHDKIPKGVPHEVSLCLFRVLQEALHNAVKHSNVRQYDVRLGYSASEIRLTVSDHGTGFSREAAMSGSGLGLVSMRERVRLVNGTIVINSNPQHGTSINVRVPIGLEEESQRAAG
jgi:PAS domain S-box-containing protein